MSVRKIRLHAGGQFLIEAMVAIGLISTGLLGVLALLSNSISLNRVVSDQYTGSYLAAEGIEVVKSLLDANVIQGQPWNSGFSNGSFDIQYNSNALISPASGSFLRHDNGVFSYTAGELTPYVRTLQIELVGANEVRVSSRVDWSTRGGGTFSVNLEDRFFNWR